MEYKAIHLGYVFIVISSEFKVDSWKMIIKGLRFLEVCSQLRPNINISSDSLYEDSQVPVKSWSIYLCLKLGAVSLTSELTWTRL